jgi:hypothetical protein
MKRQRRKHHQWPRYYLGGFSEPATSFIWVFERGAPYQPGKKHGNNPRRTGLGNVGLRRDGYAAWRRDGQRHFDVESELQKKERQADDAIRRLRSFERPSSTDKTILAEYIALMWRRGGAGEQQVRSIVERQLNNAGLDRIARRYADAGRFAEAGQFLQDHEWFATAHGVTERHYETILSPFSQVRDVFTSLRWALLRAPTGEHFVTCDAPVVYDSNRGLKSSPLRFPISRDVLIVATMTDGDDLQWLDPSEDEMRAANIAIIGAADREVYASRPDEWIHGALTTKA